MGESNEYYDFKTMKPVCIKGEYKARSVWINDNEITPLFSLRVFEHTANGFDWGNSGEGSAQLALAILLELTANKRVSMILHHLFSNEFIVNLPKADFEITIDMGDWFSRNIHRSGMLKD